MRSLGRGLGKAGDKEGAAKALGEAARLEAAHPHPNRFYWLSEFAKARALAGDLAGARATADLLMEMAETLPLTPPENGGRFALPPTRPIALYQVAAILEAAGEKVRAADARKRAFREVGEIPDRGQRSGALAELMMDRSRQGDLAGAREISDASLQAFGGGEDKTNVDFLMSVAFAQARFDVDVALRTTSRITDALKRAYALRFIARQTGEAGQWKASAVAWRALLKEDLARTGEFVLPDLAIAQARSGDRVAALTTARQALGEAERVLREKKPARLAEVMPQFLPNVALALWEAGDREAARATLATARDLADSTKDQRQKDEIAQGIAFTMVEIGGGVVALENLPDGTPYPPDLLPRLIEKGATARVRAGDVPGAARLLELVPEGARKAWTTSEIAEKIARTLAKSGESEVAIQWAEAQSLPYVKARALLGVVGGMMDQKPSANP